MKKNKSKSKNTSRTSRSQRTIALADIEKIDPISRVAIPSKEAVNDAKEWVDSNEK